MKPYYERDGITILHGDCLEIAPALKADALVTRIEAAKVYGDPRTEIEVTAVDSGGGGGYNPSTCRLSPLRGPVESSPPAPKALDDGGDVDQTYSVRNLSRYQHYKDRNPSWIKWHATVLTDHDFASLSDGAKWFASASILLASRYNNIIPCDPIWLCGQTGSKSAGAVVEYLKELKTIGFIQSSILLASCKQNASPETETETETETENSICPATEPAPSLGPHQGPVFPVHGPGQKTWTLPDDLAATLAADYPSLDLPAELRAAHAWLVANSDRRKTARGMPRFLANWLNRATNVHRPNTEYVPVPDPHQAKYDAAKAVERAGIDRFLADRNHKPHAQ